MLVDDHEVVRLGLKTLFSQSDSISVIGEAGTVTQAISVAGKLNPDVILMDLRLPDGTGIEACREILSANPSVKVLFLTSHSDDEAVFSTVAAGASGYLLKEIGATALVAGIESVNRGESILDAKVTQPVLQRMTALAREVVLAKPQPADTLSSQERRVLALVVDGKTNKEIAKALGLSDKTVKNYLSNAFQKLRINRRAQAAGVLGSRGL